MNYILLHFQTNAEGSVERGIEAAQSERLKMALGFNQDCIFVCVFVCQTLLRQEEMKE